MAVADLSLPVSGAAVSRTCEPTTVHQARLYFLALSVLGIAAFILGVENRFTVDGLFFLSPPVDLVPPLSADRWLPAFIAHQQDPVFAACGGTESLDEFQMLYWWEWLRRASMSLVVATAAIGLFGAGVLPRYRFALPRLVLLLALVAIFLAVRIVTIFVADYIDEIARYNVGQYRHAVDITLLSAVAAIVIASIFLPPQPFALRPRVHIGALGWLWIGAILLDICFGAMVASRDAAPFWVTWPGYQGQAFPGANQLMSYSPMWLNLTFNPYAIQLVHRMLSDALWVASLTFLVFVLARRSTRLGGALILFTLLSAQMIAGIATLKLGVPPALSIAHQVGGIFLLAASLVVFTVPCARSKAPMLAF